LWERQAPHRTYLGLWLLIKEGLLPGGHGVVMAGVGGGVVERVVDASRAGLIGWFSITLSRGESGLGPTSVRPTTVM
jgi:hypothetical protein